MFRNIDRACSIILAIGGIGHGFFGTLMMSPLTSEITLWSFSGSLAVWCIAAMNWLRTSRRGDFALALCALIGALTWAVLMAWLMWLRNWWTDPRPVGFVIVCGLLAIFRVRDLFERRPEN